MAPPSPSLVFPDYNEQLFSNCLRQPCYHIDGIADGTAWLVEMKIAYNYIILFYILYDSHPIPLPIPPVYSIKHQFSFSRLNNNSVRTGTDHLRKSLAWTSLHLILKIFLLGNKCWMEHFLEKKPEGWKALGIAYRL